MDAVRNLQHQLGYSNYYPHMSTGKVWIYRLLFVVCFLFVCTVMDFSGEDKASGIKFCTVVYGRPGQGISHFGKLCSPWSSKSATHWKVKFRVGRATVITCLSIWCGVWTLVGHVWIYGRPQRRMYLLINAIACRWQLRFIYGYLWIFCF